MDECRMKILHSQIIAQSYPEQVYVMFGAVNESGVSVGGVVKLLLQLVATTQRRGFCCVTVLIAVQRPDA